MHISAKFRSISLYFDSLCRCALSAPADVSTYSSAAAAAAAVAADAPTRTAQWLMLVAQCRPFAVGESFYPASHLPLLYFTTWLRRSCNGEHDHSGNDSGWRWSATDRRQRDDRRRQLSAPAATNVEWKSFPVPRRSDAEAYLGNYCQGKLYLLSSSSSSSSSSSCRDRNRIIACPSVRRD